MTITGIIGALLIIISIIISIYYGIILIVRAFQAGILWGLGYLFVPFVALIFVFTHWEETKSPFLKGLIALPLVFIGIMLMPPESLASIQ